MESEEMDFNQLWENATEPDWSKFPAFVGPVNTRRGFANPDKPRRNNGESLHPLICVMAEEPKGYTVPELVEYTGWSVGQVRGVLQKHSEGNAPYFQRVNRDKHPLGRYAWRYKATGWCLAARDTLIRMGFHVARGQDGRIVKVELEELQEGEELG